MGLRSRLLAATEVAIGWENVRELVIITVPEPHRNLTDEVRGELGAVIQRLYRSAFTSAFARADMTAEHALSVALGPLIAFVQFVFAGDELLGVGPAKILEPPGLGRVYYRNAAAIDERIRGTGIYTRLVAAPLSKDFPLGPFAALACMSQSVLVWQAWRKISRGRLAPSLAARTDVSSAAAFAAWYEETVLRPIPDWGKGSFDRGCLVQRRRWPDDLYDPRPRSRDARINDWWFGQNGLAMDRGDMAYLYADLTTEEGE